MDVSKQLVKYQEALIVLCLYRAFPERIGDIRWNEKFQGRHIDPDVTLHRPDNKVEAIFCVAHSDSEKESNRKVWRNAAELALSKTGLTPVPIVINIIFEPVYKPETLIMMDSMFDTQLSLIADVGLVKLVENGPSFVQSKLNKITKKQEILNLVKAFIASSRVMNREFLMLSNRLKSIVEENVSKNEDYWVRLKANVLANNEGREKFVSSLGIRRGLSKLLCFDHADRALVLHSARTGNLALLPEFALGLGWLSKAPIGNLSRVIDGDLVTLAASIDDNVITETIESIDPRVLTGMRRTAIDPCRNAGARLSSIVNYFNANSGKFKNSRALSVLFKECFSDPTMAGRIHASSPWIFEFCLAIGKAIENRPQGFGLSQLARLIEIDNPDSVRFWGPAYEAGKALPSANQLTAICKIFSEQVLELVNSVGSDFLAAESTVKWMSHTLVEVKLCTYPTFKPAELLVAKLARQSGYQIKVGHLYASSQFTTNKSVGQTKGIVVSKLNSRLFIKVQSGAKNTRDKAKELAGRNACSFEVRTDSVFSCGYDESILILDGPFKVAEAELCQVAGWTRVVSLGQAAELFRSLQGNT
jgi:hypothetical protein